VIALRACKFLAFVLLLAPFAYLLGRLKTFYYFHAFGVGLDLVQMSATDHAVESWFVLQNLLFFALMLWVAIRSRLAWVWCVALFHGLIPIAAHYAFVFEGRAPADWLIQYRHTLLKGIPFLVLLIVWWSYPRLRASLREIRWPYGLATGMLLGLVLTSWAISTAKHFGSFDAQMALRWPERHLTQVRIDAELGAPGSDAELYLLHANPETLVIWDRTDYVDPATHDVRFLLVPRDGVTWIEGRRTFQVQPGSQFL